jgi:lysozyme family protein
MSGRMSVSDDEILATIIRHEGKTYSNDPADAGGPTKFGITLAVLTAWRGERQAAGDVQSLTQDEAEAIYRSTYIKPFISLPDPLRLNVIDMAVNAGVGRATKLLQQMVGADVDGWIGSQTLSRVAASVDWNTLYVGFRLSFYENLIVDKPGNRKWRNGWRARALSFLQ